MDVLEPKEKNLFNDELRNLIFKLKFGNYPIEIKGSSSLKSQRFYSDYDLLSTINKNITPDNIFLKIKEILKRTLRNNKVYFKELKIQNKDGEKFKIHPHKELNKEEFIKNLDNLDFIKIDFIAFLENRFIEVSIIYKFTNEKLTREEYLKSIKEDIDELKKEGDYYKILKRFFNVFKVNKDYDSLLYLTEIFNSDLGLTYQKVSNLEAIIKLIEDYQDDNTIKRVKLNLKEIKEGENIKSLTKLKNKLKKSLNKGALFFYEELKDKYFKILETVKETQRPKK